MSLSFDDFFEEEVYKKTRGNIFKLHPPRTKTKLHRNFFSSAVVEHWNKMKTSELQARSVNKFKHSVDKYFSRAKIW